MEEKSEKGVVEQHGSLEPAPPVIGSIPASTIVPTTKRDLIKNMQNWEEFPLAMKIRSLEAFYDLIIQGAAAESNNKLASSSGVVNADELVLESKINFKDQIKHNNPTVVKITLDILITYTRSTSTINYNVAHVVSGIISKVMIRREFREKTIELVLILFSKCRDGLHIGVQEIFAQTAPKPICETLHLFELILAQHIPVTAQESTEMREFMRAYVPSVFSYSQFAYQEVRNAALKLFIALINGYGEAFVAPYKSKLKSNQIEFVNKHTAKPNKSLIVQSQPPLPNQPNNGGIIPAAQSANLAASSQNPMKKKGGDVSSSSTLSMSNSNSTTALQKHSRVSGTSQSKQQQQQLSKKTSNTLSDQDSSSEISSVTGKSISGIYSRTGGAGRMMSSSSIHRNSFESSLDMKSYVSSSKVGVNEKFQKLNLSQILEQTKSNNNFAVVAGGGTGATTSSVIGGGEIANGKKKPSNNINKQNIKRPNPVIVAGKPVSKGVSASARGTSVSGVTSAQQGGVAGSVLGGGSSIKGKRERKESGDSIGVRKVEKVSSDSSYGGNSDFGGASLLISKWQHSQSKQVRSKQSVSEIKEAMNPKVCSVQLVFENKLSRKIRSDSSNPSPLLQKSGSSNRIKSKNKDEYVPILLGIFDEEDNKDNQVIRRNQEYNQNQSLVIQQQGEKDNNQKISDQQERRNQGYQQQTPKAPPVLSNVIVAAATPQDGEDQDDDSLDNYIRVEEKEEVVEDKVLRQVETAGGIDSSIDEYKIGIEEVQDDEVQAEIKRGRDLLQQIFDFNPSEVDSFPFQSQSQKNVSVRKEYYDNDDDEDEYIDMEKSQSKHNSVRQTPKQVEENRVTPAGPVASSRVVVIATPNGALEESTYLRGSDEKSVVEGELEGNKQVEAEIKKQRSIICVETANGIEEDVAAAGDTAQPNKSLSHDDSGGYINMENDDEIKVDLKKQQSIEIAKNNQDVMKETVKKSNNNNEYLLKSDAFLAASEAGIADFNDFKAGLLSSEDTSVKPSNQIEFENGLVIEDHLIEQLSQPQSSQQLPQQLDCQEFQQQLQSAQVLVESIHGFYEQQSVGVRGYFFPKDLRAILEVMESASGKEESSMSTNSQILGGAPQRYFFNSFAEGTSKQSIQSVQPAPHSVSSVMAVSLRKMGLKSIIKTLNESNKLTSKLTENQKDQIMYILQQREGVHSWFNAQEYSNVSVISFFLTYMQRIFVEDEASLTSTSSQQQLQQQLPYSAYQSLGKFWNFSKFLSFNNAMIQSQAIHVMHVFFKAIHKVPALTKRIKLRILRETLNKLIKIIPVSRDKLFDQAFAFIDYLFELDLYNNYIFDSIAEVLQSSVPKQTVSSLRILQNFLRLYGGKRLNSLQPFMHVIKTISFSANLQVRNAAIEFYQEAYSWMGDAIFEYTKNLKKSQLVQLEKAFSQVVLKEIRPLKCPEHVFTPIMNNEFFDEKENIFAADSDTHKQKLEDFIRKALAVQEWVKKDEVLEKIVNDACCEQTLKEDKYMHLVSILEGLLCDWNKYLIENTLGLIRSLALKLKRAFVSGALSLFEKVFEMFSNNNQAINRDKIAKALIALFMVVGLQRMRSIYDRIMRKNKHVKELINVLNYALKKSDGEHHVREMLLEFVGFLKDKDSQIRVATVDLFGKVRYLFGSAIVDASLSGELRAACGKKIAESAMKFERIQSFFSQKKLKKLSELKMSGSSSLQSEMSTASQDRQYFYVQLELSQKKKKEDVLPIQQFKIQKKQQMIRMQRIEDEEIEMKERQKRIAAGGAAAAAGNWEEIAQKELEKHPEYVQEQNFDSNLYLDSDVDEI